MLRLSLRELFVAIAIFAFAIVSLRYATDPLRSVVQLAAMVLFFAAAIVAVIDRGRRQAFAIGFALTFMLYGALMLVPHQIQGGSPIYSADLDTNGESYWLGTTYPLRVFHALIAEEIRVAAILPPAPPGSPPPAPYTEIRLNPSPGPFMALGHIWSALLLGYIGGRFAQFVYRRRTSEQPPEARK